MRRTGASSPKLVPADVLISLNAGLDETVNLSETLAMDFSALWLAVFGVECEGLNEGGVTRRMALAGSVMGGRWAEFQDHQSDTVRGWACYARVAVGGDLSEVLRDLKPFAADPHFGVREWVWLAVRGRVIGELDLAIEILTDWSFDFDPNVRRFASEVTRPRGVWCAHIADLKLEPWRGLPLLEPLRDDCSRYVQDSVANWLNDAGKSQPEWVRGLIENWRAAGVVDRIAKRAVRSLQ
jgi:3-methyladenine DNA glycosylase AlkC